MGEPWKEPPIERRIRSLSVPVTRSRVAEAWIVSEAVTAAVVGLVVALVTSLGVSLACFAYLR